MVQQRAKLFWPVGNKSTTLSPWFLILASLFACTTRSSRIKTDETRQILGETCDNTEPYGDLDETLASVCACLEELPNSAGRTDCPSIRRWRPEMERMSHIIAQEAMLGYQTGSLPTSREALRAQTPTLDPQQQQCLAKMQTAYMETLAQRLQSACQAGMAKSIQGLARSFTPMTAPDDCWRLVAMTTEACVKAEACDANGARFNSLPLTETAKQDLQQKFPSGKVPADISLTLCHDRIASIQRLKDPKGLMTPYNLSFVQELSLGRSAPRATFGAANCHGTAQYVVHGGILEDTAITSLSFQGPDTERSCGEQARQVWNQASQNGMRSVSPRDLPITRGGFMINMKYRACTAQDCGKASFNIFNCDDQGLEASVFIQDMCFECWEKKLAAKGFQALPTQASWRDLTPGCVLSQEDHSIAFLMANDGLCYFYESASPYGPPQLRVNACSMLWLAFPWRYCPQQPLHFSNEVSHPSAGQGTRD